MSGWVVGGLVSFALVGAMIWDHLRSKRMIGLLESRIERLEVERAALIEAQRRANSASPGIRERDRLYGIAEDADDS